MKKKSNISHNLKKLITLLSDESYHSGTMIGDALDLTRSGVWKLIKQLEKLGIEIESVTNKGYKLRAPIDMLDKTKIKKHLQDKSGCINKILLFDDLPSTNTYLVDNANYFDGENVVCLAEQQTAGRGRLGREWVSPFAANIYLSLLWNFPFNVSELSGLNVAIGVAIAESIQEVTAMDDIKLKWPNDVFYNERKLSGVLVEILGEYNGACRAVIGVGINVCMPMLRENKIQKPWIDIFTASGKRVSRNKIAGVLLSKLIASLTKFEKNGLTDFMQNWNAMDYLLEKHINVRSGASTVKGIVKGINHHGHLVLETKDRTITIITTGDASVIGIKK